jgi:hypothetical protein
MCQKEHWVIHKVNCREVKQDLPDNVQRDIEDLANYFTLYKMRKEEGNECHCLQCSALCLNIPGGYDPFHVLKLVQENPDFYASCVQDYFLGGTKPYFYLRPATVHEAKGTRVRFITQKGSCSYLGPNGCTLRRDQMPIGCVVSKGCDDHCASADKREAPIIWGTKTGLRVMKEFEDYQRKKNPDISLGDDHRFFREQVLSTLFLSIK